MKALDIDGVICPFTEEIFIPAMNAVLGRSITIADADRTIWGYADMFRLTRAEELKVWSSEEIIKYMGVAKPITKGIDLVKGYIDCDIEHCFITSRSSHRDSKRALRIREVTKKWIKDYTGSDGPVYFITPEQKHVFAKAKGVYTMFEDKPETVLNLAAAEIYVFMPVYDYNKNIQLNEYIIPIENWMG